jgi:coenzyme PQQ biosynthesis protein C/coenzyme PQQ biosynthesis protein PqqD
MNAGPLSDRPLSPDELEAELRAIGAVRYHHLHPFHKLLHAGRLTRAQVQAWALNRYYYQAMIPIKDAHALVRLPTSELRREWRRRIIDHDGDGPGKGGIERWLKLAEGVGLDRAYVQSTAGILPGTRFAVEAYVNFVRDRPILEGIASSLTEMFSPGIIADRVRGMLAGYSFITAARCTALRLCRAGADPARCFRAGGPMMDRFLVSDSSVLAFAPHIVFRFDEVRQRWIILAPERLMLPDEQAVEILQLVYGRTGVSAIVDSLAARYSQAPRDLIAKDVTAMLQDLADKGCLSGARPD